MQSGKGNTLKIKQIEHASFIFFIHPIKHLFYKRKDTSCTYFAALVTNKTSRHSYPLALLILSYNFSIFFCFCWLYWWFAFLWLWYACQMTAYVQFKLLRKIQIWLKTLILLGKSSKMAPNSERLSPEWNKFQEPWLCFDVNFVARLYGI